MAGRIPCTIAALLLSGCAANGWHADFVRAAATAPEDMPARIEANADGIVAAAAAIGPGGLPSAAKTAMDAIAPGGVTLFLGREWGPWGQGYRVEKRYDDGPDASYRSALVAGDGSVLQRSHSVPIAKTPAAALGAAMPFGRDIRRCEIVSDAETEREWRITTKDGGGRTLRVRVGLDGRRIDVHRVLGAELGARAD